MNEAFLKLLTLGVISLVVVSALWLAGRVQSSHKPSTYRMAQVKHAAKADVLLAALPVERAASAATALAAGVR